MTEFQSEVAPKRLELRRMNVDKKGMYFADQIIENTYRQIFQANQEALQYELNNAYKGKYL